MVNSVANTAQSTEESKKGDDEEKNAARISGRKGAPVMDLGNRSGAFGGQNDWNGRRIGRLVIQFRLFLVLEDGGRNNGHDRVSLDALEKEEL